VNYTRLSPVELTAVFNHPAIHRHSKAVPRNPAPTTTAVPSRCLHKQASAVRATRPCGTTHARRSASIGNCWCLSLPPAVPVKAPPPQEPLGQGEEEPFSVNLESFPVFFRSEPPPNAWMEPILSRQSIRDWFSRLVYGKVVERFGNSQEGRIGLSHCWAVALGR
jgi:hypothetical protein